MDFVFGGSILHTLVVFYGPSNKTKNFGTLFAHENIVLFTIFLVRTPEAIRSPAIYLNNFELSPNGRPLRRPEATNTESIVPARCCEPASSLVAKNSIKLL